MPLLPESIRLGIEERELEESKLREGMEFIGAAGREGTSID